MQLKNVIASTILMASATIAMTPPTAAQDLLTGDTRLACEAILCLSTGSRPDECTKSLNRLFDKKPDEREPFLDLCPMSKPTPEMQAMLPEITEEAMQSFILAALNAIDNCTATALNKSETYHDNKADADYIKNQLPVYCSAYANHAYTNADVSEGMPRYVGKPQDGGFWSEADNYEQALKAYEARPKKPQRTR